MPIPINHRNYIVEKLESYLREVVGPLAPPVQIEETRRAFMAGAGALFAIVIGGLSVTEGVTGADNELMHSVYAELEAWKARMIKLAAERPRA